MSNAALLRAPAGRTPAYPPQVRYQASLSQCGTYRWTLQRWLGTDAMGQGPILPWIMLNPSTADGRSDDPTLKRIIGFSWRWGFDGLLVLNLFPYRSAQPRDLGRWVRWDERQDWSARDALHANWRQAAELLRPHDAVMVAWGAPSGALADEVALAAEALFDTVNEPDGPRDSSLDTLFCLGLTGSGAPAHPMARGRHRIPDDAVPQVYPRHPGTLRFGARANETGGCRTGLPSTTSSTGSAP